MTLTPDFIQAHDTCLQETPSHYYLYPVSMITLTALNGAGRFTNYPVSMITLTSLNGADRFTNYEKYRALFT